MDVGVLVHERDGRPFTANSVVRELVRGWRRRGIDARIIRGPRDEGPLPRILLMHVDLTEVPPEYAAFADRCPVVINRATADISKRAISGNVVRPGDGWDGPVIVKTDLNCGGVPEQLAGGSPLAALGSRLLRMGGVGPRRLGARRTLDPRRYPVFESADRVPAEVYENPALVAERFLPERDGDLYCVRVYLFLGDRDVCTLRKGRRPIVKDPWVVHREEVDVHPGIREARDRLGFDYGKFDYVLHGGRPVLLDASRTPVFGGLRPTAAQRERAARIGAGLERWL